MDVYRPAAIEEALQVLAHHGERSKVIAGGTALSILIHNRLLAPDALVDISRIGGLDGIDVERDQVRIGAMVRHRAVELSGLVRSRVPVLSYVFGRVGNVRVRHQATVGGVVAEADYASDPPAVLVGLDASVTVAGPNGASEIPASSFFKGFFETVLEPAEIITDVSVPAPETGFRAVYKKYVTRSAEDRPCVGVFAACKRSGRSSFDDVRVVVGAVSNRPMRFAEVESIGNGTDLGDDVCGAIADGYADRIEPLSDVRGSAWYRTEMIRVWVRRALIEAREAA
jgi:aerobic carbon-monoxide dehydrogenase medium subunit